VNGCPRSLCSSDIDVRYSFYCPYKRYHLSLIIVDLFHNAVFLTMLFFRAGERKGEEDVAQGFSRNALDPLSLGWVWSLSSSHEVSLRCKKRTKQNRAEQKRKRFMKSLLYLFWTKDSFCTRRLDRHLKSKWHQKANSSCDLWPHKSWLGLSTSQSNVNFFRNWQFDLFVQAPWQHSIGQTSQYVVCQTPSCALAKLLATHKGQMLLQSRKEQETIRSRVVRSILLYLRGQ